MDGPWQDSVSAGGIWNNSVRNDALWEALKAERIAHRELCNAWRDAAVADGWSIRPTYPNHEPAEHAFTMERDGFRISGLARPMPEDDRSLPRAAVSIWGPDGAAIAPPLTYDWAAIQAGAATCGQCGAHPVETKKYAFANRCCAECGPKFLASLPDNWAD